MNLAEILKNELPQGKFWTDAWSLVEGCTPVSPGCANCWLAGIYRRDLPNLTPGLIDPKTKHFNGKVVCREDRLEMPFHARKPRVYAIWSDLFHERVSDEFRSRALTVMALTPRHHYIIVTKRPQEAARYIGAGDKAGWREHLSNIASVDWSDEAGCHVHNILEGNCAPGYNLGWPLSNVTILVTMEDQQRADERVPYAMSLVDQGWRVGALCEPLLGPISFRWCSGWPGNALTVAQNPSGSTEQLAGLRRLSWVITGGESGSGARPMHPDWVPSLRMQAQASGTPFLFKQWGEWGPWSLDPDKRHEHCEVHPDGRVGGDTYKKGCHEMARVGKKKSGRTLFTREWLEVPA